MNTYRDDNERLRCGDCSGYLKPDATTCPRCEAKAANAAVKVEEEERRAEAFANRGENRWRRARLARYVRSVLATSGAERTAFFDAHPLSNIFK